MVSRGDGVRGKNGKKCLAERVVKHGSILTEPRGLDSFDIPPGLINDFEIVARMMEKRTTEIVELKLPYEKSYNKSSFVLLPHRSRYCRQS